MDQWGKGKAFQCKAADCGTEVNLYLRAKIGFCNCTTGVADDEELERLSDFDLMGRGTSTALGSRTAHHGRLDEGTQPLLRDRRCGAAGDIRALDRLQRPLRRHRGNGRGRARSPGSDRARRDGFLNGTTVMRWAEVTLGL